MHVFAFIRANFFFLGLSRQILPPPSGVSRIALFQHP
jgi:hypothetical protein